MPERVDVGEQGQRIVGDTTEKVDQHHSSAMPPYSLVAEIIGSIHTESETQRSEEVNVVLSK